MKITLLTANQPRHNYLITILSRICKELYVIQESRSNFQERVRGGYIKKQKLIPIILKKFIKQKLKYLANMLLVLINKTLQY